MENELTLKESSDTLIDSDIEKLAKGTSVSFVGKLGGRIIFAVSQIVLARMLGPEQFGLYALGWASLRLVGTLAPLGLGSGIIRYGSRYWPNDKNRLKDVLNKGLIPSLVSGVFAGLVVLISAPLFESFFQTPGLASILRGFAIAVPLFVVMRVSLSGTQIWQRMQYTVISEDIGQPTINLLLITVVFLLGGSLYGTVAVAVISWGFASVLAVYYLFRLFPDFFTIRSQKGVSVSELLLFSLPTAFAGTFTFLTSWVDRILLGLFATTADVGIYQALAQPALIIAIVLRSVNTIFTPMIANLYERSEMDRLRELYKISTKWGIYLSVPVFLFICFTSQEIMMGLFGAEYASGALPLVILVIGQMINVSTGAVGFALIMTGYERLWLIISIVSFMLNAALNVVLVPPMGLVGAAIATSIAISTLYLSGLFAVRRLVGLWPYDARYRKGLVAIVLTMISLTLANRIGIGNIWLRLLTNASVSVAVFIAVLWRLGLDSEDREFLALLLKKVRASRVRL